MAEGMAPPQRSDEDVRQSQYGEPLPHDCDSHIGTLDKALNLGPRRGWAVVSMRQD
jgi:hypothetical protein